MTGAVRCVFCDQGGHHRAVHAHLVQEHGERVVMAEGTARDGVTRVLTYEVRCPLCEFAVKRIVNPRGQDPRFLEENAAEIRLVAFDQLLYHAEATHAAPAEEPAAEG